MTDSTKSYSDEMRYLVADPARALQLAVRKITEQSGFEIGDPTNPVVQVLEFAAMVGATAVDEIRSHARLAFPSMAITPEELYGHMADSTLSGVFASPSSVTLKVSFNEMELKNLAIPYGNLGVRRIEIPKNTAFSVGQHTLSIEYPVYIDFLPHGGVKVSQSGEPSPAYALSINRLPTVSFNNYNDTRDRWITIDIPVYQFKVTSHRMLISGIGSLTKKINFSDQFMVARVMQYNPGMSKWVDMAVSYSKASYDIEKPTAIVTVGGGHVEVSIPHIYYRSGQVSDECLVLLYTTAGEVEIDMSTISAANYSVTWQDHTADQVSPYSAPLSNIASMAAFSVDTLTGGRNGLSFQKLRKRVIDGVMVNSDAPISKQQVASLLDDSGFNLELYTDNVTERIYLASKDLEVPESVSLDIAGSDVAGAGSAIMNIIISPADEVGKRGVIDNGKRMTFTPDALYITENGVSRIVGPSEILELETVSPEALVSLVNSRNYAYSPFHTVISLDRGVSGRTYYFGQPAIDSVLFIGENTTYREQVTANSHTLSRTTAGWKLTVVCGESDALKELADDKLKMQIRFIPHGETKPVYRNATMVGKTQDGNRVFEVAFETTWDVSPDEGVIVSGFDMFRNDVGKYAMSLNSSIELMVIVESSGVVGSRSTELDEMLGDHLIDSDGVTIIFAEKITVALGSDLKELWTETRLVPAEYPYERYSEDIPKRYPTDVLKREGGKLVMESDDEGHPRPVVEFHAGDVILDQFGDVVYEHRAGDTVLNMDGYPEIIGPRKRKVSIDLLVVDGIYYFANTASDDLYKEKIPSKVVSWIRDIISPIAGKLLAGTRLLFKPQQTLGLIEATVDNNIKKFILAEQHFVVDVYCPTFVYTDLALRERLAQYAKVKIAETISGNVVTNEAITAAVFSALSTHCSAVKVSGLGGNDYSVISISNATSRLRIGKVLKTVPDGTFETKDAIVVNFHRHDPL